MIEKQVNGYVFVRVGELWIAKHRLVVEEKIGRLLNNEEVVHHIDFNKENNKPENLMLFPNQKEHMKFHLKLEQFGLTNPIKRQIEELKV